MCKWIKYQNTKSWPAASEPNSVTAENWYAGLITPQNTLPLFCCPAGMLLCPLQAFLTLNSIQKRLFLGILALKPADTNLRCTVWLETFVPASDSDLLMLVALDLRFLSAIRTFLLSVLGVETFYMYCQSVLGHRWIIKLDSNCWYSQC